MTDRPILKMGDSIPPTRLDMDHEMRMVAGLSDNDRAVMTVSCLLQIGRALGRIEALLEKLVKER